MEGERPPCTQKIYKGEQDKREGRLRPSVSPIPPIPPIPMEPCGQPTLPSMIADRLR